jgi:hypothetical protein
VRFRRGSRQADGLLGRDLSENLVDELFEAQGPVVQFTAYR